jgi:hypothetical protein
MLCTCGCNQQLSRRAIKNHLLGLSTPRLVTAAVKARQVLGRTISPPRLNPPKKLRSSRRYFPSLSASANVDGEADFVMSGDEATSNGGMSLGEGGIVDDEEGTELAIKAALDDVWSGPCHDGSNSEEEYDDDHDVEEGYGDDGAQEGFDDDRNLEEGSNEDEDNEVDGVEGEDAEFWNMYGRWNNHHENGLSALDMLEEDFERNAVARGEFMYDNPCSLIHDSNIAGKLTEHDMSIL